MANNIFSIKLKNYYPAFTLAEVLITLGIIGIVAAMTISSIVSSYKKIELENRFKKVSSTIENAAAAALKEYGMEGLLNKEGNAIINSLGYRIPDDLKENINNEFSSKLNIGFTYGRKPLGSNKDGITDSANKHSIHSFLTNKEVLPLHVTNLNQRYILKDGSSVSLISFQTHGLYDGIKIYFDTNGAFKGPNRFGYDIFIYDTGGWNINNCADDYYAYGCYKYAQQNINPQDKSKPYWKSLKI